MISYHRFIDLLHKLFLEPISVLSLGYTPKWSTNIEHFDCISDPDLPIFNGKCIWWHEEPLNIKDLEDLKFLALQPFFVNYSAHCFDVLADVGNPGQTDNQCDVNFQIFANSEKSKLKKDWFKKYPYLDWYFFFHGFAALDWYRDFKYLNHQNIEISKVFICLNHLISDNRSYRLSLLSHLENNKIMSKGFVSAPLLTPETIKSELYNKNSRLSPNSKKLIYSNLLPIAKPIVLDDHSDYNNASADIIDPKFSQGAMWHVVTETIYYDEKLHLTEKIFKPIVSQRPFILVGAVGNLAYLKTYGFKTFDQWIDESYDSEPDPDIRMGMIVNELTRLCSLPHSELLSMYKEMKSVIEHNYNHFYGGFKEILVDELTDNFKKCVFLFNRDLSERYQIPSQNLDYAYIKKTLMK